MWRSPRTSPGSADRGYAAGFLGTFDVTFDLPWSLQDTCRLQTIPRNLCWSLLNSSKLKIGWYKGEFHILPVRLKPELHPGNLGCKGTDAATSCMCITVHKYTQAIKAIAIDLLMHFRIHPHFMFGCLWDSCEFTYNNGFSKFGDVEITQLMQDVSQRFVEGLHQRSVRWMWFSLVRELWVRPFLGLMMCSLPARLMAWRAWNRQKDISFEILGFGSMQDPSRIFNVQVVDGRRLS